MCCINPDVRTVFKSQHYEVVVSAAMINGYWYEGLSFTQHIPDIGGWCYSPCATPNRVRHASKEDAERHAVEKVLKTVLSEPLERSAAMIAALRGELAAKQLTLF